jgi:hypothetical protein
MLARYLSCKLLHQNQHVQSGRKVLQRCMGLESPIPGMYANTHVHSDLFVVVTGKEGWRISGAHTDVSGLSTKQRIDILGCL